MDGLQGLKDFLRRGYFKIMGNNLYKQRHKEQGLCTDCSRKALPGKTRCFIHLLNHNRWKEDPVKHKIRVLKLKKYWEKNNLCSACGGPLDDLNYKRCMNCRSHNNRPRWAYWHELRARNINYN